MNRAHTAILTYRIDRLWTLVRESLRTAERDLTSGSIRSALIFLAIPMVLELSMEAVFSVVDILFVARLGTDAVAVVGLTEAMLTVLYSVCIGFGMAVTAIVARRIGELDAHGAASTAGQAMWISLVLAALIGGFGSLFAEDLLGLMGASDAMISTGSGYTRVLLAGSASIFYLFVLNAVFRGAGDAAIAMRSLWLANGVNLLLDPCLIFGLGPFPELGVTGAAVATTIGRSTGVIYQLMHMLRGDGRILLRLRHIKPDLAISRNLFRLSCGGIGQFLVATSSWLFMMRIIATFGSSAIAGFTIALRLIEFVFLPAWGLGNAAATLVGQNLGAGHPDRARRSAWRAARYNCFVMSVLAVVFISVPELIVGVFTNEPELAEAAVVCIRWIGLGMPFYSIGMILVQALNGAGDTVTPTLMNMLCFWLVQIPLALWLARCAAMGVPGVLIAILLSESLLSVVAIAVFRRGRWQEKRV